MKFHHTLRFLGIAIAVLDASSMESSVSDSNDKTLILQRQPKRALFLNDTIKPLSSTPTTLKATDADALKDIKPSGTVTPSTGTPQPGSNLPSGGTPEKPIFPESLSSQPPSLENKPPLAAIPTPPGTTPPLGSTTPLGSSPPTNATKPLGSSLLMTPPPPLGSTLPSTTSPLPGSNSPTITPAPGTNSPTTTPPPSSSTQPGSPPASPTPTGSPPGSPPAPTPPKLLSTPVDITKGKGTSELPVSTIIP
ncbi:unnamed protein product [Albugo candida]|uniref:Uncharacterized protein n=1 Tax=Albugo candida TaxID=65357 RepID=A0A024G417_9STRA|nr:unnamed protein product [Albugo candida]|eukprot:CCI41376.1 unnamed protein product [Albugo candida]